MQASTQVAQAVLMLSGSLSYQLREFLASVVMASGPLVCMLRAKAKAWHGHAASAMLADAWHAARRGCSWRTLLMLVQLHPPANKQEA